MRTAEITNVCICGYCKECEIGFQNEEGICPECGAESEDTGDCFVCRDDQLDYVGELIAEWVKVNPSPFDLYRIEGCNMGWRGLSGSKYIRSDGEDFVAAIAVDSPWRQVWSWDPVVGGTIKCVQSHHDSMGEVYRFIPVTDEDEYERVLHVACNEATPDNFVCVDLAHLNVALGPWELSVDGEGEDCNEVQSEGIHMNENADQGRDEELEALRTKLEAAEALLARIEGRLLVEAAARGWCSEYDDIAEELGFARRPNEWSVGVEFIVVADMCVKNVSREDAETQARDNASMCLERLIAGSRNFTITSTTVVGCEEE